MSERNVLVAEDDEILRSLLEELLDGEGCAVVTASDGQEARRLVEERDFELIILDLLMPGHDGVRFLDWLRELASEHKRATPVLVLSSMAPETLGDRAVEGRTEYLRKPADPMALLAKIQDLLQGGQDPLQAQDPIRAKE